MYTDKSFRQIVQIVKKMKPFFRPADYHVTNRNCLLLFARKLVRLITGEKGDGQIGIIINNKYYA